MRQALFVAFIVLSLLLSAQAPPAAYLSAQVLEQVALMAAEENEEYEKRVISRGGWPAVDQTSPGPAVSAAASGSKTRVA